MRSLIRWDARMCIRWMIGDTLTLVGTDWRQLAGMVDSRVATRTRDASSAVALSSKALMWWHIWMTLARVCLARMRLAGVRLTGVGLARMGLARVGWHNLVWGGSRMARWQVLMIGNWGVALVGR